MRSNPLFVLFLALPLSAATTCESLTALQLPSGKIDSAQTVAAGAFTPPVTPGRAARGNPYADLPTFCRITATLTPTTDSDIKIEVWLPATSTWNHKYEAVGRSACATLQRELDWCFRVCERRKVIEAVSAKRSSK
jgi:feruloyl esterase